MFTEDQLLPISALQHLLFCPRQCGLIHIEQQWAENRLTVEGHHLHDKAHDAPPEVMYGVMIVRGLALRSLQLGLAGKTDVVEFHWAGRESEASGPVPTTPAILADSQWTPMPVEYKRGKPKKNDADRVQLCAQAICLEEMLNRHVPTGALFYGRTRRRLDVFFDESLRTVTRQTAERLHEMIHTGITPTASRSPKCKSCSLVDICLPHGTGPARSVTRFLQRSLSGIPEAPTGDNMQ